MVYTDEQGNPLTADPALPPEGGQPVTLPTTPTDGNQGGNTGAPAGSDQAATPPDQTADPSGQTDPPDQTVTPDPTQPTEPEAPSGHENSGMERVRVPIADPEFHVTYYVVYKKENGKRFHALSS